MAKSSDTLILFCENDLLSRLGKSDGGVWTEAVISCVDMDIRDGMVKKEKEDALQAAQDYFGRLEIWVNAQFEMLPAEKKNENQRTAIWTELLNGDPREMIVVKKKLGD